MQTAEHTFLLLTVNRIGNQLIGLPRPARVVLSRDGAGRTSLAEGGCTFDWRFREAVESVWSYLHALLPEHTAGLSMELGVKGRGAIGGGSIALPLSLVLLGAVLDQPLPAGVNGTGLMGLADGWFTGQLLVEFEAKAQAIASKASPEGDEAVLVIPYHRQVPLPQPVPGVRYLPVANLAAATEELFPDSAGHVQERFRALSTLGHLPLSPAIKAAFRERGAQAIVLETVGAEPVGDQEIEITDEPWGTTVWVRWPGLPGGGTMLYRFHGEQVTDKEHFGDPEQARELGSQLRAS